MKVSILLGSVREGRQSHKAAYYVANALEERGIETDLIDLAETPLPVHGSPVERNPKLKKNIKEISARLMSAHALIFVTPEYHGSLSGVLKNAIDYFWEEFRKKPVGVVTTSAGRLAGINASVQLQHIILSLGAFPAPFKLLIPEVRHAFDEGFEPQNEKIVTSTQKFLDEFLWFADALYQKNEEKMKKNQNLNEVTI